MSWSEEHTHVLVRGIISTALENRSVMYTYPELSQFARNGGDKINKRLQIILTALEKSHGTPGMVKQEVQRLSRSRSVSGKKRKVEVKDEEEDELAEDEVKPEVQTEVKAALVKSERMR